MPTSTEITAFFLPGLYSNSIIKAPDAAIIAWPEGNDGSPPVCLH